MTVVAVLHRADAAGVTISIDADDLVLRAAKPPDTELMEAIRQHKADLIGICRARRNWSEEDWQALYDERAGIIEFDGAFPRAEAEERARDEIAPVRRLVEGAHHG